MSIVKWYICQHLPCYPGSSILSNMKGSGYFCLHIHLLFFNSLKDSNICKLSKDFFEKVCNLEELVINNNELTALPLDPWKSYESMKSLNIAQNKLQSTDELVFFSNLEHLDISGNDQIQV